MYINKKGKFLPFQEVLSYYEILRVEFPGAKLIASTLEDFFSTVEPIASHLPVIEKEIGDTWIQGIATDPRKEAEYRGVSRCLKACLKDGKHSQEFDGPGNVVNGCYYRLPVRTSQCQNVPESKRPKSKCPKFKMSQVKVFLGQNIPSQNVPNSRHPRVEMSKVPILENEYPSYFCFAFFLTNLFQMVCHLTPILEHSTPFANLTGICGV